MRETTIDEMPLYQLRRSAERSARILRSARRRARAVGDLAGVDEALDDVHRLLPGLMDRSGCPTMRTIRSLSAAERAALRTILEGKDADASRRANRLAATLGFATTADALAALERATIHDRLASEVLLLLRTFEVDVRVDA